VRDRAIDDENHPPAHRSGRWTRLFLCGHVAMIEARTPATSGAARMVLRFSADEAQSQEPLLAVARLGATLRAVPAQRARR
jgi:hypothetical protein